MGSGKSLLGKLIAQNLAYQHLDSDKLIEKERKKKIIDIFSTEGEASFRSIEEKVILNLYNKNKIVLSLGGGSILSKKVRDFLKNDFITLFLDVDKNILVERLKKTSKRPLLLDTNIEKKIKELDIVRRKYYSLSDIILTNNEEPDKIIKIFLHKYSLLINNEKNN